MLKEDLKEEMSLSLDDTIMYDLESSICTILEKSLKRVYILFRKMYQINGNFKLKLN